MKKVSFKGTGVAIVTPFRKDSSIDFKSFSNLIEFVIKGGVDYIVSLGTTGEVPTIFNEERSAIIDFVKDEIAGRVPLVVGVGGNSTKEVTDFMLDLDFNNIDGVLSVCPYYNKPTQKGIITHFKTIASVCKAPLIIYNVPGRTCVNILPETTIEIANECESVVAVKEASGDLLQCMEIIKNKPKNFEVLSGDDALMLPQTLIGVDGVISVVANAFPNEYSKMVNLALEGNYDKAKKIHYQLLDIINLLFAEGNPVGIKAMLEIKGIISNNLRSPLVKLSRPNYNKLKTLYEAL